MKQNLEMNIVEKFEADWVRIEEVMTNVEFRASGSGMWDRFLNE